MEQIRADYESWWTRRKTRIFDWCHIPIGTPDAPEVLFTSHTWLTQDVGSQAFGISVREPPFPPRSGCWNVRVERDGRYLVSLRRWPREADAPITSGLPPYEPADMTFGLYPAGRALPITEARLQIGDQRLHRTVGPKDISINFELGLSAGTTRMQTWFCDKAGDISCGAFYVYIRPIEGESDENRE